MDEKQFYELFEEVEKAMQGVRPTDIYDPIVTRMAIENEVEEIFVKFGKKYFKKNWRL